MTKKEKYKNKRKSTLTQAGSPHATSRRSPRGAGPRTLDGCGRAPVVALPCIGVDPGVLARPRAFLVEKPWWGGGPGAAATMCNNVVSRGRGADPGGVGGCRFLASYLGNSNSFRLTSPRGSRSRAWALWPCSCVARGAGLPGCLCTFGSLALPTAPLPRWPRGTLPPSPPDSVRKQYRVRSGAGQPGGVTHELAGRPGPWPVARHSFLIFVF